MKKLGLTLASLTLLVYAGLTALPAAAKRHDRVAGQLVVRLQSGSRVELGETLAEADASVVRGLSKVKTLVVRTSSDRVEELQRELGELEAVASVEPDYLARAVMLPNDPAFANQWGLENTGQRIEGSRGYADDDIDAPAAWDESQGAGVKVAVLDTGIDQDHPDLDSKLAEQVNFSDSPTADDLYGHGTHVAGIVAAETDNRLGIAGTCPGCRVMNVKVLNDEGSGAYSWIANGIIWAADHGAKVINLSLGGRYSSAVLEQAVNYAWSKGAVVVAAAGNSSSKSYFYPAAYTNAIAVAATTNKDRKASFSNYGYKWVDVAAPGQSIFSTLPNHDSVISDAGYFKHYDYLSGTSMAAPMVSAVAALVWDSPNGTSASSVRTRLQSKADRISGTGNYWAHGRVNADRAVTP